MDGFESYEAFDLSLGQKQRITIAGVLALSPKVIVFDEPTAMLDPEGKKDILDIVRKLKEKGYTIVYITNVIDEIFVSDRVIVIEDGKIVREFETKDVLDNVDFLKCKGMVIPKAIEIKDRLASLGIEVELYDLI